ncbi:MAG: ribose-phosphate diphosphokinase [Candidatus Woesearchaeota archaeon]|nr:ribose-phosphate diphosphokinase [Candidatus Woesearchaeota archaeon]
MTSLIDKPFAILANPEGRCWKFAEEVYSKVKKMCKREEGLEDKIALIGIEIKRFRDGEIKPKIQENIRKKTCFFIHDSSLNPDEWFLQVHLINYAIKFSSASELIDIFPYLPFSRQDRKDESRVPISARSIADALCLYANRVITVDVHAPQIQGFYNLPFDNLLSFPYAVKQIFDKHPELLEEELAIMTPDAGGTLRASTFKDKIVTNYNKETNLIVGYKQRPKAGEVSNDYRIAGDAEGRNVIIIDDIIDSGNTLVKASQALKNANANKIYTYSTHALFTDGFSTVKPYFERVFVSNTRMPAISDEKLEILDMSPLIAEAIYRTAVGESLSALFK